MKQSTATEPKTEESQKNGRKERQKPRKYSEAPGKGCEW
jgi:hypothetical protein